LPNVKGLAQAQAGPLARLGLIARMLPAPALMVLASLLFATMSVCVKLASKEYGAGEIVFYRGAIGLVIMAAVTRIQGGSLRSAVPSMHLWRSLTGVVALVLWFYAIGNLPLATAMTLNYMSSVWMAVFLIGGAAVMGTGRIDGRLVATILTGFAGVALILRPTIEHDQLWHGVVGLLSGVLAATAYLQVAALTRVGEPVTRIVFYFSVGGLIAGAALMAVNGAHSHTASGLGLLLAVGLLATVAQLLMTRAYHVGKALVNASLQYLGIVFSLAYGVLLFDERIGVMGVAGIALIVCAGLAATLLRSRSAEGTLQVSASEG